MKHDLSKIMQDVRPAIVIPEPDNLRLVRCCESCKYYNKKNKASGFCKYKVPKLTNKQQYLLTKVAPTTVCDNHKFLQGTLKRIEKWLGKSIDRVTLNIIKRD